MDDIVYRPLSADCPRSDFRCAEPEINRWFLKDSLKRHDSYGCRVVTAHIADDPRPIGFYAMGLILESDRFLRGGGPIRNRASAGVYPALHLEYMAVDEAHAGRGLGADILGRTLIIFRNAVMDIGIPVMTLVPFRDELTGFYSDRGFVRYALHRNERRMMLTAREAMSAYEKAKTD